MPLPLSWAMANKAAQTHAALPVSIFHHGHYLKAHQLKLEASLSPVQPQVVVVPHPFWEFPKGVQSRELKSKEEFSGECHWSRNLPVSCPKISAVFMMHIWKY